MQTDFGGEKENTIGHTWIEVSLVRIVQFAHLLAEHMDSLGSGQDKEESTRP